MDRVPFIIAEAGSCHEEQDCRASLLVAQAFSAGADAVKFQYWSSPARMRERRKVDAPTAYERGSIKLAWMERLRDYAHGLRMEFMCTAYLPEDIKVVAPYVDRFKIASFEADDDEFVLAHQQFDKPLVVSTGMDPELRWLNQWKSKWPKFLHCVSAYPTPLSEASLYTLGEWVQECEPDLGYSDHTRCVYTGGFAVSAGADILEVHFRLDDTSPDCPDYPVALSPAELKEYIRLARLAHTMRGDGVKKPQPSEILNMKHRVQP